MMRKDLYDALKALERIVDTYHIDNMDKEISIIEAALERLERLDKSFKQVTDMKCAMERKINRDSKKLKALEILKKLDFEIEDYTKDTYGSIRVNRSWIILEDEDIDIVKEVLKK